jgi:2-oxoglutarate ferredoxin oxidoreductase subunit alpha
MPEVRKAMHAKRMKKLAKVLEELEPPDLLGDGERYVVAWGSTAMPLLDYAAERKIGVALFRDLYPLPLDSWVERLNSAKEVVAVELNYSGQFANYLASKGVRIDRKVLKWWGEPFSIDELGEWL